MKKINLFADDVILTLTDVEASLQATTQTLSRYYRVNFSKSLILGFHIAPDAKTLIQSRFPYVWNASSIPYLGIHFTISPSLLCGANFPPHIQNLQSDLARMARVDNSWLGRIVIYKMIILPKILYVLRALPTAIPNAIFTRLHSQMKKMVWLNRKPRLSFQTMTKHLHHGGLGLPNLKAYHRAVTLDQMKLFRSGA